jgi:hypothetical protein
MIINISNNRILFISSLVHSCNYKSYLELGVDDGKNITSVANFTKSKCFGVDVMAPDNIDDFTFYKMTTDEFFESNTQTFDVIFVDACHNIDFVIRDLENSIKVLNKNGIILLHDIDPISIDFIDNEGLNYSSNAYEIVDYIYVNRKDLNISILPVDEAGIAIVNRKSDRRIYGYMEGNNV